MKSLTLLKGALFGAVALAIVALILIYAGWYNVAADEPHARVTHRLFETARDRSIAAHASGAEVPPLDDPALVARGAEEYAEMCTTCHLAPGMKDTPLRAGLYPQPPDLTGHASHRTPEENFWIIKHGIKMTGMPAWGLTHGDDSIWAMVAFLRRLPELSRAEYESLVAQAGDGHSHGDEGGHSHGEQEAPAGDASGGRVHRHADGRSHVHEQQPASGAAVSRELTETEAVVRRFFAALAAGRTEEAEQLLDPDVLIYEGGGVERSRQEYAAHHLKSDAAFLRNARHRLLSSTGGAVGDLAWVASEAELKAPGDGGPRNLRTTETMVLRKAPQGWRIVHVHWSSRPAEG